MLLLPQLELFTRINHSVGFEMQSSVEEGNHQTSWTRADLYPKDLEGCVSAAAQGDLLDVENLIDSKHDISAVYGSILCAAAYRGHLKSSSCSFQKVQT